MQPTLPDSLPNLQSTHVLVMGDVMLDRYWLGDTARISPEAPVPIVKVSSQNDRPGGAGNVALNIAALGANVTLLGAIGQDEAGKKLTQLLEASGVKHDLCQITSLHTIIKLRVISRQQQLLRLDFEEPFTPVTQADLKQKLIAHIKQKDVIIFSDYGKGTLADIQSFIQVARECNTPIVIDPKSADFSRYKGATLVTPNLAEFQTVVGQCQTEADILSKARTLIATYDISALLITRSEAGMTLITKETTTHLPAYAREVFDVTGAGDTVIATLAAMLAAKLDLTQACALSNLAASLTVSKLGAATVSAPELSAALTHKKADTNGIVNEAELIAAVTHARTQGKKIVFTNGCYDILHAGHVASLQLAKSYGDCLIVAVNEDASIKKLKGENRPINRLDQRMTVLAGLSAVDWVVPFADDTPERLLQLLRPDVLVKGGDYQLNQVVGADIVRAYGGEVRIAKHGITTSSTHILEQMTQEDT